MEGGLTPQAPLGLTEVDTQNICPDPPRPVIGNTLLGGTLMNSLDPTFVFRIILTPYWDFF